MHCTMYCTAKGHKKQHQQQDIVFLIVWCGVLPRPAFFLKSVCCSNHYLGIHFPLPNSQHSIFHSHSISAIGYELAIIITYPTSASGIIVSLKMPTKYWGFFPTLFVKTTNFQPVFNFEQTRKVNIFGEHGIMAHIAWWLSQSDL